MSKFGCSYIYTSEYNRLQWAGNTARYQKTYSWLYVLQRLRGSHLFNTMLQMLCRLTSAFFHAALCRDLTKNFVFVFVLYFWFIRMYTHAHLGGLCDSYSPSSECRFAFISFDNNE